MKDGGRRCSSPARRATSTRRGCCWTTARRSTGRRTGADAAVHRLPERPRRRGAAVAGQRRGGQSTESKKDGWTPLYIACWNGHVDAARLLLDNGAEVDRADGRTVGRRCTSPARTATSTRRAASSRLCRRRRGRRLSIVRHSHRQLRRRFVRKNGFFSPLTRASILRPVAIERRPGANIQITPKSSQRCAKRQEMAEQPPRERRLKAQGRRRLGGQALPALRRQVLRRRAQEHAAG